MAKLSPTQHSTVMYSMKTTLLQGYKTLMARNLSPHRTVTCVWVMHLVLPLQVDNCRWISCVCSSRALHLVVTGRFSDS